MVLPLSSASRARVSYAMAMSPSGIFSSGTAPCSGGAGNDNTLVGFCCPRHCALRRAMVLSSHSRTDSSALRWCPHPTLTRSRGRVVGQVAANAIARRTMSSASGSIRHASDSIRMSTARAGSGSSNTGLFISVLSPRAERARSVVIGGHDLCHQLVAYDVLVGEYNAADAVDVRKQANRLGKARGLAARQVDLAGIAGDDHAAVLAQPGQEHLHLHRGGVLGLIQDDDRVGA